MERIIQVALTSFGMSGQVFHGPCLKANPRFKIKYILERTKNLSAEKYPDSTIVRTFDEILNDPEIELVVINSPNQLHYPMAKQALHAGKNVLLEKPFTQTSSEALEIIQLAKEKELLLTVYQNRRWDGDFLTLKEIIDKKLLGRLVEFESHYDRYRNFVQEGSWKEIEDDTNGVLYNLGSHMIDQVLVLFGMPKSVTAHLDKLRDGSQVVDYYDIRLQYEKFAAILKSSYLVRDHSLRYTLQGTLGSFKKHGIDPQEEALMNGRLPNEENWGNELENNWGIIDTEEDGKSLKEKYPTKPGNYKIFYENMYDAIVYNAPLLVNPTDSLNGLKIIEACLLSNKEKRTVFFDPIEA